MSRVFPTVTWGNARATFLPGTVREKDYGRPVAALVFAFDGARIVIADIKGRGWCVPSGRLEPGESPEAAARREAWEEAGLILGSLGPLGLTVFHQPGTGEFSCAQCFVATVARIEPIPDFSESRGRRSVTRSELPDCYYLWDDLIASIFNHAWERQEGLPGDSE